MVPSFVWSTHPVCVPIVSLKRCVLCYSWALLRRPVFRLGLGTGNSLRRSVSLWPRDTIESFPLQGPAVSLQRGAGLQPLLVFRPLPPEFLRGGWLSPFQGCFLQKAEHRNCLLCNGCWIVFPPEFTCWSSNPSICQCNYIWRWRLMGEN